MKSSARTDGPFRVSQCFYTAAEFSKSVSVAVTQPDPNNPGKRTSREFWKETFGRYSGQEKERDDAGNIPAPEHRRPEVEREASVPPKRIPAIGDEAYWTVGPGGAPMRILLVEDHADSHRCMHRLLESRGHTVHSVGDAQSAIKLGEREEFDLLITDIGLPDRSGLELLRELRQRAPELPAIALSGFGMPSDVVNSKEAGFAELFVKPVDLQKLHAVINTLAGRNGRGKRLKPPKQTHPRKSAL